jgi:transcriptional regulator with XRE-family HTH domain
MILGKNPTYAEKSLFFRHRARLSRRQCAKRFGTNRLLIKDLEHRRLSSDKIPPNYAKVLDDRMKSIGPHDHLLMIRLRMEKSQEDMASILGCGLSTYNAAECGRSMRNLSFVLARLSEFGEAQARGVAYNPSPEEDDDDLE